MNREEKLQITELYMCSHNYILIQEDTTTDVYKCTVCGRKMRKNKVGEVSWQSMIGSS